MFLCGHSIEASYAIARPKSRHPRHVASYACETLDTLFVGELVDFSDTCAVCLRIGAVADLTALRRCGSLEPEVGIACRTGLHIAMVSVLNVCDATACAGPLPRSRAAFSVVNVDRPVEPSNLSRRFHTLILRDRSPEVNPRSHLHHIPQHD